jgi:hypothetical protein
VVIEDEGFDFLEIVRGVEKPQEFTVHQSLSSSGRVCMSTEMMHS